MPKNWRWRMDKSGIKASIRDKFTKSVYANVTVILLLTLAAYFYVFHTELKHSFQLRVMGLAKGAASLINPEDIYFNADLQKMQNGNPEIHEIRVFTRKDILSDKSYQDIPSEAKADDDFKIADNVIFLTGYAPVKGKDGIPRGAVLVSLRADAFIRHELLGLLGACILLIVSLRVTVYRTNKIIDEFLNPLNEIIYGAKQIKKGILKYRIKVNTRDEVQELAEILNEAADSLAHYQEMLKEKLSISQEYAQNIYNVYKNVIYSLTQGKFTLLDDIELELIQKEGTLLNEIGITKSEDVNASREYVKKIIQENVSQTKLMQVMLCVSEGATNILKHANGGTMQIRKLEDGLRIIFKDNGPGMDLNNLSKLIFLKGYSTKNSLGFGLSMIYQFADKMYLLTSNQGTYLAFDFINKTDPGERYEE